MIGHCPRTEVTRRPVSDECESDKPIRHAYKPVHDRYRHLLLVFWLPQAKGGGIGVRDRMN